LDRCLAADGAESGAGVGLDEASVTCDSDLHIFLM